MRSFLFYISKLLLSTLLIVLLFGTIDRYSNMLMLPTNDVSSIKESSDIFIGSSHTLYHINPHVYDSLSGGKTHIVATGAQYSVESLHYLTSLGDRGLLKDKNVYIQLETKDGINKHPDKSWMMLNLRSTDYMTIWNNSATEGKKLLVESVFVDFLSFDWIQKVKMKAYSYKTAQEIRRFVPFDSLEYEQYRMQNNGDHTDDYGQQLISSFINEIPSLENSYKCKIVYYRAGGCHSNLYSKNNGINDLRWMDFMSQPKYWQDTNHLTGEGARIYTRALYQHFNVKR